MNTIKIGIVEDEVIIAYDIQSKLKLLGYTVVDLCNNYTSAIEMLKQKQPDLVILDINLHGENEGIEVGKYIRQHLNMPFIYLTANSDTDTISKAKETMPDAYLTKPFSKDGLYSAIEIALYNFNKNGLIKAGAERSKSKKHKDFLFVKVGDYFQRVVFADVLYVESEHNYVTIHTAQKKFVVRTTLQEFLENLDPERFVRIHRSFIVNLDKIEKINTSNIIINGREVPISANYREELMKTLNIR